MEHSGIMTFKGSDHKSACRETPSNSNFRRRQELEPTRIPKEDSRMGQFWTAKIIQLPGSYQAWAYSGAPWLNKTCGLKVEGDLARSDLIL